jgi:hypothetical protein
MALETVAANGSLTGVKKGKEGFARFKFPSGILGLAAVFTGEYQKAYIQDWSIDASLSYDDDTPMGEENKVLVFKEKEVSGSANFNFRVGSAPLLAFNNVFADVIDKAAAPANDVTTPANPEVEISVQLFIDSKHYYEGAIKIQSIGSKGSAGGSTTYSVSWKFDGAVSYVRLPSALVEA